MWGGSSSSSSSGTAVAGTAQLGYISGGTVKLFALTDLTSPIATTVSSTSSVVSEAGRFTFKKVSLITKNYYLVEVSGGKDIDPNDDGVIDADEAVELKGSVYALAKGLDLENGDVRINALSDMAYQKLKGSLSNLSDTQIKTALDKSANQYLFNINEDSIVDYKDILAFDPTKHLDRTKKSYRDILEIYIPKLHNGDSDGIKLASLMYLDNPKILIENGNLQEVPFPLNASLENVPNSVEIKWYINSSEKTSIDETITEDGIYQIKAELSQNDKVLKTVSSTVIATTKVEIASIDVDIAKDNTLTVSEESNTSLVGAKIIIPKGALAQNTTIKIKKSSINMVPSTDAIGISDVIVLEPSGLTFDKPVQVRIPYYQDVNLTNQTVRIARYSKSGQIDYLTPLYIDEENHEIVFETDHFTEFKAETSYPKAKHDEVVITEIEDLTGLSYTVEEWVDILNAKITKDGDTTVYDLYLSYLNNKKIVELYNDSRYEEVNEIFYADDKNIQAVNNIWNDLSDAFELINVTVNTYDEVSTNLRTILVTKKYFSQIASNIGIPGANPIAYVLKYTTHVFSKGLKGLSNLSDSSNSKAYEFFYTARKEVDFKRILDAIKTSKSNKGAVINITEKIFAKDGFLRNGGGAQYSDFNFVFSDIETLLYSANLVHELIENFQALRNEEHVETFKNIIQEHKKLIQLEKAKKNKTASFNLKIQNVDYKEDEVITVKYSMNLKGYDSDLSLNIKTISFADDVLIDKQSTNCEIDYYHDRINRTCKGSIEIDTKLLKGNYSVLLQAYYKGIIYDTYLDTQFHLSLRKILPKKQANITGISFKSYGISQSGNFVAKFTPTFETYETPPCDVSFDFNGKKYRGFFTIKKADFTNASLSSLKISVKPKDLTLKAYDINTPSAFSFNLSSKILKAIPDLLKTSWSEGDFGDCTGACGEYNSIKEREVVCKDYNGATIDDSQCTTAKPFTTESCTSSACEGTLTYSWNTSSYGNCIGSCGAYNAIRIRTVTCQDSNGATASESFCTASKPSATEECTASACEATPKITNLSPVKATLNEVTTFTVSGINLPDAIAMSLQDSAENSCSILNKTSTSVKMSCIPSKTGSKSFYVKNVSNGTAIPSDVPLIVEVLASSVVATTPIFTNDCYNAPKNIFDQTVDNADGSEWYECTRYAYGRSCEKRGVQLTYTQTTNRHGGKWYDIIDASYERGSEPKANSLAVWSYGTFGHVAFVESVNGENVSISEANWSSPLDGKYKQRTLTKTQMARRGASSQYVLKGYVYLTKSLTYSWQETPFGDCTGSCGTDKATQTREVTCQDSNGTTVEDSFCTATKPEVSQVCSITCPPTGSSTLKKTGQTTSHTDYDDGYYKVGVTRNYSRGSDIVTDHVTGLEWQDDTTPSQMNWEQAKTYCSTQVSLGGHTDWRLPTRKELVSLSDYGRTNPAIDPIFDNTISNGYWGSTIPAGYSSLAWLIYFDYGY